MELLALLQSRNKCLDKFRLVTDEFLAAGEAGLLERLPALEARREAILKALDLFDRKIAESMPSAGAEDENEIHRIALERDALIRSIFETDERVMALIRGESDRLSREVASVRKGKELLARFKSNWIPQSGGEMDGQL